jgi:Family of unknown function (DUF6226)
MSNIMQIHRNTHPDVKPAQDSPLSNAARLSPLHNEAIAISDRLFAVYDVLRGTTFDLVRHSQPSDRARESISLTPCGGGAPLEFCFTGFPSLIVRYGHWQSDTIQPRGAAGARDDDAMQHLRELVDDIVAGRLTEEIEMPWFGTPRMFVTRGPMIAPMGHHRSGSMSVLGRTKARELRRGLPQLITWAPWPRRG